MRRRRRRGNTSTRQQYFRHKMTKLIPLKSTDSDGDIRIAFCLQNTANNNGIYGFDSSERWGQTYKNYESYAVKGMKLKYIPTNSRGGVSQNVSSDPVSGQTTSTIHQAYLGNQLLYFDVDTYAITEYTLDQIVTLDQNWTFDPSRTWKKYFSAKNLSRQQNLKWQDTKIYQGTLRNELTSATIGFAQPFYGQGDGSETTFGFIKATWYVTFKGQALGQ